MKALFILITLLLTITVFVNGQTFDATIMLPTDSRASFGEIITIPIFLSTDSLINQAQFVVEYDSTIIHFLNALPGKDALNFSIAQIDSTLFFNPLTPETNDNVLIKIAGENTNSMSGNQLEVIDLSFQVKGHLGSTPLACDPTETRTSLQTINQNMISNEKLNFIDGQFTVEPETTAVLKFVTDTLNVKEGIEFTMGISIAEVWDLHSFKLGVSFDPGILRVKAVDEGSFLNQNGFDATSWTQPIFDNVTGMISNINCSRSANDGVNGSGTLVMIHFQTISRGLSTIEFITDQITLLDPRERKIPVKELSAIEVNSYGEPVAELSIGDTIAAPNQIIDIPIHISGIDDASIISALMNVKVDTSCLIPIDVLNQGTLTANWQKPAVNVKGGNLIFALAGYQPLANDGVLVWLRYLVNTRAKESNACVIQFENVLLNEGDPSAITSDGHFRVRGLQLSGSLSYCGTIVPIPDIAIELAGTLNQTLETDIEGNFSFTQLSYGDYKLFPFKQEEQVNCVTPFDAALVLQQVVQLTQFSPYQMIAADVTGDSTVSALDAANIMQYSVRLIDKFPVMPGVQDFWRFVPQMFPITQANWVDAPDSLDYSPLSEDQFNQNFLGIIYGDVSQNWQFSGLTKTLAQSNRHDSDQILFGAVKKINDSQIQLPVILNENSDVMALQLGIAFDQHKMKFITIEKAQNSTHFDMVYNVVDNTIKIAMACAQPKRINGDLIYLIFSNSKSQDYRFEFLEATINENQIIVRTGNSFIDDDSLLPTEFQLFQNYPNPFNNQTIIKYAIPDAGHIQLHIYNIVGKRIRTLVNEPKEAGYHTVNWSGDDEFQNQVASGTYFIILKINDMTLNRKVVYIK